MKNEINSEYEIKKYERTFFGVLDLLSNTKITSECISIDKKLNIIADEKTGYEDAPDWKLQTLVHTDIDNIEKLANEGIRRAVANADKEWIIINIIGAVPNKVMKKDIKELFEIALNNKPEIQFR